MLSGFGWPLLIGGVIKVVYDILLLINFQKVRLAEEAGTVRRLILQLRLTHAFRSEPHICRASDAASSWTASRVEEVIGSAASNR